MGGGEHGHGVQDFRAKVWSMSGGPYCRPKHWRRNTAIAMFGVFLICIPIAMKSAKLETSGLGRMNSEWGLLDVDRLQGYVGRGVCSSIKGFTLRPLRSSNDRGLGEQRPHQPVRPIPSQLWCKNFGNKDY
ncbi:transmembrane protein [Gossypium australe]|uniref:Transmembrane protein n=1 Tax=Gossypium australe TaxID=47621 RepID=A0A5B6VJX4_9ROSI|nr:transmembrane protein [Gossypium australe]